MLKLFLCLFSLFCIGCSNSKDPKCIWRSNSANTKVGEFKRKLLKEENRITQIDEYKDGFSDTFSYSKSNNSLLYRGFDILEKGKVSFRDSLMLFGKKIMVFEIDDSLSTDDNQTYYFNEEAGIVLIRNLHSGIYYYLDNCKCVNK